MLDFIIINSNFDGLMVVGLIGWCNNGVFVFFFVLIGVENGSDWFFVVVCVVDCWCVGFWDVVCWM